jgi:hypothetical protein
MNNYKSEEEGKYMSSTTAGQQSSTVYVDVTGNQIPTIEAAKNYDMFLLLKPKQRIILPYNKLKWNGNNVDSIYSA